MLKRFSFLFVFLVCLSPFAVHAAGADLRMDPSDIQFSKATPIVGDTIRVYTKIQNVGTVDVTGYVTFYNDTAVIGEPQVISVVAGGVAEQAFVDFVVPSTVFSIRAVISGTKPVDVNLDNNIVVTGVFTPIFDDDRDGIVNASDNCPAIANPDQLDTDKDRIGDLCDDDMDGDGLSNAVEKELGTNVLVKDTDGDGVDDAHDAYPLDPKRSVLEKPVAKVVAQTKLVTNPDVLLKASTVSPSPSKTSSTSVTEQTTGSGSSIALPATEPAPSSATDTISTSKTNVSSNAVFTYEKSSWNTFSFRMIAPVQDHSVYEWDFGDGVHSSKTTTSHTYVQAGTYHVSLKTTNDKGEVKNESAEVQVSFFCFSNPWLIGLLALLGLTLIGTFIGWIKMRSKKQDTKKDADTPLKQIHVKEE